ncbi:hypothetical protein [Nitrospira sp. Kam-Ns4a]
MVEAKSSVLVGTIVLLIVGILAADAMLPIGIAVGVLYVVPVLVSVQLDRRGALLGVAAICTLLLPVGFVLSPPGVDAWIGISNRLLGAAAIWLTAILSLRQRKAQGQIRILQGLLPICASCKSLRGINGTWQPMDEYLEALSNALLSNTICPRCVEKWYPELYPELTERHPDLSQRS